ncbi:glutamate carboxypeptidase [Comamonas odontotermitis]
MCPRRSVIRTLAHPVVCAGALLFAAAASGEAAMPVGAVPSVYSAAQAERQPLLDTLQTLVNIESGSKDFAGVSYIAQVAADKLKALGGAVQIIRSTDPERLQDTPEQPGPAVQAVFKGSGHSRIMLIAHMDTVYHQGDLAQQPFRIDGERAYGLGIEDEKQGVALVLHSMALLQKIGYDRFGQITVLFNSDEEISSPGSRKLITALARDQDAVFSFESGGQDGTLHLATSGIGALFLSVEGKASHAGARPEYGVNALYELSHQLLQMRNLSQPERGLKLNWTLSQAGSNRNVIPAHAEAQADARALRVQDFDALQSAVQERIRNKLFDSSRISARFELRRPPMEASDAARKIAAQAQQIYRKELDLPLRVNDVALGGGTDAAFAALSARGGVVEGMGLGGFGAHSNHDEYILLGSIVPRLYLVARMVMELSAPRGEAEHNDAHSATTDAQQK